MPLPSEPVRPLEPPPSRRVAGVERDIFVLGLVSFFADVAGEMLYPIVPVFLTATLGAPVFAVGLVEGVAESTAALVRTASGWLSDRVGRRKPLVALGYGLSAVAKPLLALAFGWPLVLLARFLDRTGKGLRGAPRDALIAEWAPPAERGRAFGFHRSMDTAGAVVGPLTALLVLWLLAERLRLAFLVAFAPAAAAVLLVALVRERRPAATAGAPPLSLRLDGYDRGFKALLLVTVVFAMGNSSDAFLILRAQDLGLSATMVVLAYTLYNAVYAALSLPAGMASDTVGRRNVMLAGLAIFAAVYLGFALAGSGTLVWPLFAVYGAYIALTDGVARALVADLVPADRRATALGLYSTVLGVTVLAASVIAGALWDLLGPAAPFLYGAATAAAAALLLVLLLPARPQPAAVLQS
ncbi:MAG TPA: MFS transporter [Dehalococcoidia bacterium]